MKRFAVMAILFLVMGSTQAKKQFIDERFNARGKIQPDIKAIVIEANRAG